MDKNQFDKCPWSESQLFKMQHKFPKGLVLGVWRLSHYSVEFAVCEVSGKTFIDFIGSRISHCAKIHVVQKMYNCFHLRLEKDCSSLIH